MPKMPLPTPKPRFFSLPPVSARQFTPAEKRELLQILQKGIDLQVEGKFIEAERFYQHVLQAAPAMPEANNLMGTLALEAKDNDLALEFFEKAVVGLPKDALIRHNLASAHMAQHDYHSALRHLQKALDLRPSQYHSLLMLASCYNHVGRGGEAVALARKALQREPDNNEARVTLADALINSGKMEEAEILLRQAIASKDYVGRAWQSLASSKKWKKEDSELAEVENQIRNLEAEPAEPVALLTGQKPYTPTLSLRFALAKMSNDAGLHDQAMEHYAKANHDAGATYDIGKYERFVDELIALFNPLFMGSRRNFGDPSQRPVFIVGMPRSGTTLTEQIISSHPLAAGAGELGEMAAIARSLGANRQHIDRYQLGLTTMTQAQSISLAKRYLKLIGRTSLDALRITDKMPHNFENVGLIALLFPNATIIHCKRDPIDNCVSCYMNAFNESHDYSCDLNKLGRYYRAYDKLMRHWHKLLPVRIFDNQYEDLVEDQEGQSRKLIAHCGLEWDEACLNYTGNQRSVNTISRWQVRQPIYTSSMMRWKPYEKHLGPLIKSLGDLVDPHSSKALPAF